jgi:hypothetical protein
VTADDVVDDRARFGNHPPIVANHRRLAERMNGFQLRWRQTGLRIALVRLDLVREPQLLQQPEDALGARIVEVMNDDHCQFSFAPRVFAKRAAGSLSPNGEKDLTGLVATSVNFPGPRPI